jgi:hypothetical protein
MSIESCMGLGCFFGSCGGAGGKAVELRSMPTLATIKQSRRWGTRVMGLASYLFGAFYANGVGSLCSRGVDGRGMSEA